MNQASLRLAAIGATLAAAGILAFLVSRDNAAPPAAVAPAPQQFQWHYETIRDAASDKDIAVASMRSSNTNNLRQPPVTGVTATLSLQNHPRLMMSVYLSLDQGTIKCASLSYCALFVRFDERPAIKYLASWPSEGSPGVVVIGNPAKFIAEIRKSKRLRIELPMRDDERRTWEFGLDGLTWP